jgi:hypothetical protein
MSRDDIQKLLGGYATGTLTPEERQALFDAALTDQELFDSLAREEALREVLSDPAARAHLLAALDDAPAPWYRQWWRPMVVMATALLIVAGVALWQNSRAPKPLPMAKLELPPLPGPATQSAPNLPPPPPVKQPAPVLAPLSLPGGTPVAPPPPAPAATQPAAPPPQSAATLGQVAGVAINSVSIDGQTVSGPPMQQGQQGASPQQARFQAMPAPPSLSASAGNNFLEQYGVLLHGVVTDPAGAGIRSASVAVKSLSTGEVVNTSTDERGEFKATGVPGGTYQISASAPGFQSATVSRVTPATGIPEPVNLQLGVGAATQTVEVTAGASMIAPRAAPVRAGTGGFDAISPMTDKKAKAAPKPGLEYHLLRRVPGGDPVEVPPGETVPPGAGLILRVTPAADGYLRIAEGSRAIARPKVKRGVAFDAALPPFDQPGSVELQVYFSPQAAEAKEKDSKAQAPSATVTIEIR